MGGAKVVGVTALAGMPLMIFVTILGLVLMTGVDRSDPGDGHAAGVGGGLLPGSIPDGDQASIIRAGTQCPEITAPLIAAQLQQESDFNPEAISPGGARGIAQFTAETWRIWGKDYSGDEVADVWDVQDAIGSQADYLCGLADLIKSWIDQGKVTGDVVELTLAGYNAGPAWVLQAHGVPPIPETRSYIKIILASRGRFTVPAQQVGNTQVETAISAAEAENHDRYVFGAAGPDAWDCSSLVQHAWQLAGVELPRTTFEQVKSPVLKQVAGTSVSAVI